VTHTDSKSGLPPCPCVNGLPFLAYFEQYDESVIQMTVQKKFDCFQIKMHSGQEEYVYLNPDSLYLEQGPEKKYRGIKSIGSE
jgi:hypothetical protein